MRSRHRFCHVLLLGWTLSLSCSRSPFEFNQKRKQELFQFTAIVSCIINVINHLVDVCLFEGKTRNMVIDSQNETDSISNERFYTSMTILLLFIHAGEIEEHLIRGGVGGDRRLLTGAYRIALLIFNRINCND